MEKIEIGMKRNDNLQNESSIASQEEVQEMNLSSHVLKGKYGTEKKEKIESG